MNKTAKHLFCLMLAVLMMALPVFAAEPSEPLAIRSESEFLAFAADCLEDSYSKDLTVSLEADLDLSDTEFTGIPIFAGTFSGNGHTITGIDLQEEGSVQGFFRYLTRTAHVTDLHLQGSVLPQGSRTLCGGFAGSNSGLVESCSFEGTVQGSDEVGGFVGENRVSGILDGCTVRGSVQGTHFVGGIAGSNKGTIRNSENRAEVNTTACENTVKLAEITTATMLNTESANTVTDIGGIAGTSDGVLRDCRNLGTVGYPHMGYNVGGVAGSQKGLVTGCVNEAEIQGRKEVAGIVGQLEPSAKIEYKEDTLQRIQRQLKSTSALADRAASNAENNAREMNRQMDVLHGQAGDAADAVLELLPQKDSDSIFPDEDRITAAHNSLSASVSAMQGTMSSIVSTAQSSTDSMTNDIRQMSDQVSALAKTLSTASDRVGVSVTDVSDKDTEKDLTGKIVDCINRGRVAGDLNVGGIAGSIGFENHLDPEADVQTSGQRSLNVDSELRAVILRCENSAEVSVKKRYAGGTVGKMVLGLVKDCSNTGRIDGEDATYLGGIAGSSSGVLREGKARCALSGSSYIGGIAGSADFAADCLSVVSIEDGTERLGAVLGNYSEDILAAEEQLVNNRYLTVGTEHGGVDGISYEGMAQSMTLEELKALPELPALFQTAEVSFWDGDRKLDVRTLPLGEALPESELPPVPYRPNGICKWENADTLLDGVYLNTRLDAEFTADRSVLESTSLRDNGRPVLLAEGLFRTEEPLSITSLTELPEAQNGRVVLEGWMLPKLDSADPVRLRLATPDGEDPQLMELLCRGENGSWNPVEFTLSGRYLVFDQPDGDAVCILRAPNFKQMFKIGGAILGGILAVILLIVLLHRRRSRKKAAKKSPEQKTADQKS